MMREGIIRVVLNPEIIAECAAAIDDRIRTKDVSPHHRAWYEDHTANERGSTLAECAAGITFIDPAWRPRPLLDTPEFANRKRGDIVPGVQVRQTKYRSGKLVVRDTDEIHDAYILVTGDEPLFVLRGWLWGWQARKLGEWHAGEKDLTAFAWWVKQPQLRNTVADWKLMDDMTHYANLHAQGKI